MHERLSIGAFADRCGLSVSALRFYADPIGPSGVRMSEDLNVSPGDNVQLDITP